MLPVFLQGISEFYEWHGGSGPWAESLRCGPMKQLKAMMKRIDMESWKKTQNIHV